MVRLFAPGVVSTGADEGPFAFTPDGKTIYFTRFVAGTTAPQFFVSHKETARWSKPRKANFPEGALVSGFSISPDGKHLFFTHQADSSTHTRLWVAERDDNGWKNAKPLGGVFEKWDGDQASPSLTADGTLYFTSNRSGGSGGWDIYRSVFKDGQYAEPELLGGGRYVLVSTTLDEMSVASDLGGKGLIITGVDAPNGLGGSDLSFVSLTPSKVWDGLWVENLGVAVNTKADESNPQLSSDGKRLYFVRSGDIYEVEIDRLQQAPPEASLWKPRARMPVERDWPQLVAAGGKIYVYGGFTGGRETGRPWQWCHAVDVYDPASDSWSSIAPGPSDWKQGTLVAADDRLFLFRRGGSGLAEYNPAAKAWDIRPGVFAIGEAMPYETRTVALGRKAYTTFGNGSGLTWFAEYDFDTGRWTQKNALPYPTAQLVSFNDRIYAFSRDHTSVYDQGKDRWSDVAGIDMPRWEAASAVFADRIWLIGGHSSRSAETSGTVSPTVMVFDPAKNEWTNGPALPWQRAESAAISVNGRLFVMGGMRQGDFTSDRSVLEFVPD